MPAERGGERLVLHQLGHVVADGRRARPSRSSTTSRSRYNYTNEGGVGGTIRFLKNIMGLWLVQECRRQLAARGARPQLRRADADGRRGAKAFGAVIDPDHKPFLSPGDMPRRSTQFCKRDEADARRASRGEFVRTLPREPRADVPQDARRAGRRPRPADRHRSTSSAAGARTSCSTR